MLPERVVDHASLKRGSDENTEVERSREEKKNKGHCGPEDHRSQTDIPKQTQKSHSSSLSHVVTPTSRG